MANKKRGKPTDKKNPNAWKRTALIAACVVLAVILAVLIAVTAYVEYQTGRMGDLDNSTLSQEEIDSILNDATATGTGPTMDDSDVDFGTKPSELATGEHIINILLVGQDRRKGEGRQRSDAMILCTLNTRTKSLTMTSFLRDMYVKIPGYRNNKINACYQIGGADLLNACLKENFGVEVDHNVEVDFEGFMDLIDLVGGVEIELTSAEAGYLNKRGNWDVTGNDGWRLKKGINKLTGSQALAYSRIRAIGTDFERTERQRKVLTALLEKAKDLSFTQITNLINEAIPLIATDMKTAEIIEYAGELFKMFSELEVNSLRIPADGTYSFADFAGAGDSIVLDFDANRKLLLDTLTK